MLNYCTQDMTVYRASGHMSSVFFFFQAEDGIRDLVRSRGLGDVYKRQSRDSPSPRTMIPCRDSTMYVVGRKRANFFMPSGSCLLYTSDAADERSSVDLGGRRIIKKKKKETSRGTLKVSYNRT